MREEVTFTVEPCPESGDFVAQWDDPQGGGITTQGDSLGELQAMVTDAVGGYFEPDQTPTRIKIHFSQDPVLHVA